jgi:hypothetical protein
MMLWSFMVNKPLWPSMWIIHMIWKFALRNISVCIASLIFVNSKRKRYIFCLLRFVPQNYWLHTAVKKWR